MESTSFSLAKPYLGKEVEVIIDRLNDDDKLVVVPESFENISDEDIRKVTNFQERFFQSEIIRA